MNFGRPSGYLEGLRGSAQCLQADFGILRRLVHDVFQITFIRHVVSTQAEELYDSIGLRLCHVSTVTGAHDYSCTLRDLSF